VNKTIKREKQGDSTTGYAAMLNKDMAKIDWNLSNKDINNLIRGLNPWPVAYTQYEGQSMKIYEGSILSENNSYEPGYVVDVSNEGIKVACKEGSILLKTIQFSGGKPMKVSEYIKGHELNKGVILGK
jgi:methionyl-tRNA formyltransferase